MCTPNNLSKIWSPDTPSAAAIVAPNTTAATTTPAKTDTDVAKSAEEERRRMDLSRQGFVALTQTGPLGDEEDKPVKRVTLRA